MNIEKIEKGARVYYMAESNFRNRLGDVIIPARFPAKDGGYDPTPGTTPAADNPVTNANHYPHTEHVDSTDVAVPTPIIFGKLQLSWGGLGQGLPQPPL